MTSVLVALAGGLGAVARFLMDALVARRNPFRFPLGTIVINTVGSFVLGLVSGLVVHAAGTDAAMVSVVGTGFCGGFTTFSTASVEAARLWVAEGRPAGVRYAVGTALVCIAAAALGLAVGRGV